MLRESTTFRSTSIYILLVLLISKNKEKRRLQLNLWKITDLHETRIALTLNKTENTLDQVLV